MMDIYAKDCCEKPAASYSDEYVKTLQQEITKQSKELEEMREGLLSYGEHSQKCQNKEYLKSFKDAKRCICGLDELLKGG